MTEEEKDKQEMAAQAINRVFAWVKSTDVPPQVAMDIGIIIGRLHALERTGSVFRGG